MADIFNTNIQLPPEEPVKDSTEQQAVNPTLEDHIAATHKKWNANIEHLNNLMKTVPDARELLNKVYTSRQDLVDYYHTWLIKCNIFLRRYRQKYAAEYNNVKTNSQIRYTTEAAVLAQVESNMADLIYEKELYDNHADYIKATIRTIDDIIYGVKDLIELEKLISGVKF